MAIKVISGILFVPKNTNRNAGSATIDFNPHTVNGDADGFNMTEIGPNNKPFKSKPCFTVSLRSIGMTDSTDEDITRSRWEDWEINTRLDPTQRNSMVVSWSTKGDPTIHEISYMIIGEVE